MLLAVVFTAALLAAPGSPLALTTVSPLVERGGAGQGDTVEAVVGLISRGFECTIAPLTSQPSEKADHAVLCDSGRLVCYACVRRGAGPESHAPAPSGPSQRCAENTHSWQVAVQLTIEQTLSH